MNATLPIDPVAFCYVFENAFHYSWFSGAKVIGPSRAGAMVSDADKFGELARHAAMGGSVSITAEDPEHPGKFCRYRVTQADFERAYSEFAKQGMRDLPELLDGSADVNACDAWLQLAVFGKLVYG